MEEARRQAIARVRAMRSVGSNIDEIEEEEKEEEAQLAKAEDARRKVGSFVEDSWYSTAIPHSGRRT